MNKPAVLGITGRKRSGKDEIYKALAGCNIPVLRVAFADPLKQEMAQACNVTTQFIEEHKEQFRLGLQWWGTEFRRGLFGNDYWIRRAEEQFYKAVEHYKPNIVAFTDVRFPNECELIHKLGGKVWRVIRPAIQDASLKEVHASEVALDDYPVDRIILNDGTLFHLRALAYRGVAEDFGQEVLCSTQ